MTIELLSSLLLHASSTGVRVLWRATRVADLKTALVQAIVDKAPWKDDFVPYIAKFFRCVLLMCIYIYIVYAYL